MQVAKTGTFEGIPSFFPELDRTAFFVTRHEDTPNTYEINPFKLGKVEVTDNEMMIRRKFASLKGEIFSRRIVYMFKKADRSLNYFKTGLRVFLYFFL